MLVDDFSHTGALAQWILPSGEVYRVMRYFGAAARSARGEEEEWNRLPR